MLRIPSGNTIGIVEVKCPACNQKVAADPYDGDLRSPQPCPHCGVQVELDANEFHNDEEDYWWGIGLSENP